jgi:drug/metabolite transporter (DMT)-like permease
LNSTAIPELTTASNRHLAHSHARMHLLMLLATFCWAANIVAGKEALRGLDPLALAQLRVIVAALLFALVFIVWQKESMPRLTGRGWLDLLAVAACGVTFNQLFFIGGLARSSATHTGMVVAVIPVMVLVLSCALRMEPLTLLKFVGMLVSFAGVAILTTSKAGRGNGGYWKGDLILLAGSVVFALFTIIVKRLGNRYQPLTLNTVAFALGSVLMLPFGLRSALHVNWKLVTFSVWWGLAFMAVFGSVVAYLAFAVALTELTASRVAAFGYLQPMLATALSIWLLGERITTAFVISGILILAGVYLAERERGEERTAESR